MGKTQRPIVHVLKGILLFNIFIGMTNENHHFFLWHDFDALFSPEQLTLSGLWLVYASALFAIGLKKRLRYLKAFFVDLANLDALFKILLFILLGVCLLIVSFIYHKEKR